MLIIIVLSFNETSGYALSVTQEETKRICYDPEISNKSANVLEFMHEWMSMYLSSDFSKSMRIDILSLIDKIKGNGIKQRFKLMIIKAVCLLSWSDLFPMT